MVLASRFFWMWRMCAFEGWITLDHEGQRLVSLHFCLCPLLGLTLMLLTSLGETGECGFLCVFSLRVVGCWWTFLTFNTFLLQLPIIPITKEILSKTSQLESHFLIYVLCNGMIWPWRREHSRQRSRATYYHLFEQPKVQAHTCCGLQLPPQWYKVFVS